MKHHVQVMPLTSHFAPTIHTGIERPFATWKEPYQVTNKRAYFTMTVRYS